MNDFFISHPNSIMNATREKVIEMLKEEQKVRYSKGIQEAYTMQYIAAQENGYGRVNIEAEIQKHILRTFGYKDDERGLKEYWKIPSTYWEDEEVKNSIFYMKLNIFQYPKVKVGDNMIDASLISYPENNVVSLSSLQKNDIPLVILSGSMT
jgi:hypothetical protein